MNLIDRRLTLMLLREMVAMRFFQTGGLPKVLQKLLGLAEKQYLDATGVVWKSSHRVRTHPQM